MGPTKDRRAARELALDVLYQAEITDLLPTEALSLQRRQGWSVTLPDADEAPGTSPSEHAISYATTLVEGVEKHAAEIDELIDRQADRWTIGRMPIVDKNVLRLAVFELLWGDSVPTAVVINEAIELVKAYSTESSGKFINGLLGQIAAASS